MKTIYQTDGDEARYIENYTTGKLLLSLSSAQFSFQHDSKWGDVVDIRVPWGHDEEVLTAFIYEAQVLDDWMLKRSGGTPRFIIHASTRGTKPRDDDLRRTGGWEIVAVHPEAPAVAERLLEKCRMIRFSCGREPHERHRYFLKHYNVTFDPGAVYLSGLAWMAKS